MRDHNSEDYSISSGQADYKLGRRQAVQITVHGKTSVQFNYDRSTSLMEAMLQQGIPVNAACGGRGTCGKCKVIVKEGNLKITSADLSKLSEQELQQGYRLACKAYPDGNCTVQVTESDAEYEIVTEFGQNLSNSKPSMEEEYAIAIDIGTTTLAVTLLGLTDKKIHHTYTAINQQRVYGLDVISRIQASVEGKKDELSLYIRKDLVKGIRNVIKESMISEEHIRKIAIAGNTTMGHLLLGYSCATLGSYPFTPVNIDRIELPFEEVFGTNDLEIPVILLPGISTFVGGDIVAGLLACNFDENDKPCLLIDLGTNGEMAIGNKDRILVTSTAAGPAFEGGNISCGVGGISGAICKVEIINNVPLPDTIGHKPPIGICGSGVLELTSELVKARLVDETGLLNEEYFDRGYVVAANHKGNAVVFTQKDVREIQLAKAAIRAGAEILLRRFGITYDEIDKVYLAGGFGYKINLVKALHIGLLPRELSGRISAVGNSSLGGAVRFLTDDMAADRIDHILKVANEIHLSNDKDFYDLYIEFMNFDSN